MKKIFLIAVIFAVLFWSGTPQNLDNFTPVYIRNDSNIDKEFFLQTVPREGEKIILDEREYIVTEVEHIVQHRKVVVHIKQ